MGLTPDEAKRLPDDALVVAAVSGDRQAGEELLQRYDPLIRRVVRKVCHNPTYHDDVEQEARIHWTCQWPRYNPCSKFGQWTRQVITNKARTTSQKMKPPWVEVDIVEWDEETEEWNERELVHPDPTPDEQVVRREIANRRGQTIERCLAKLQEQDRQLLVDHLLKEIPFKELAEIHGVPAATLRQRAHRARERLRRCIEQSAEDGDEGAVEMLERVGGLPDDPGRGARGRGRVEDDDSVGEQEIEGGGINAC